MFGSSAGVSLASKCVLWPSPTEYVGEKVVVNLGGAF